MTMEQTMNSNMQPAKRGIKKSWILLGIVVCRGGDDHDFRSGIGSGTVEGGCQPQGTLREVAFDIFVLDRRAAAVYHVHLFGNHIDARHIVVLGKKGGYGKPYISRTGNGYFSVHFQIMLGGLVMRSLCNLRYDFVLRRNIFDDKGNEKTAIKRQETGKKSPDALEFKGFL